MEASSQQPAARTKRSARRSAMRTNAAAAPALAQRPWQMTVLRDDPTCPLDGTGVAAIDDAAMRILEEIGIEFLHQTARQVLARAGCKIDDTNVRMDRHFVREMVARAPATFDIVPRNRDRLTRFGGRNVTFGSVASPPNVTDIDNGRRTGNRKDFRKLLKLSQTFNCIQFTGGYPVEPVDLHPRTRHLDAMFDILTLTDKTPHNYSLGTDRVEDGFAMVAAAHGVARDKICEETRFFTIINSSSPLKHDWPMLDGAMAMALENQAVVVTPFTLAGAMAPITLAGAIAQQTAEALALIALLQYLRPGAPVMMGAFTSNVDMKTGAPAFGTPEAVRAMQMSGQMARHYNLPLRAQNACAANFPDGQAVFESAQSLWGVMTSGVNMVMHAAGWLEGGLAASFEKFIIDCDAIEQMLAYNDPVKTGVEELAFEAIRDVGPNGHFLGTEHTQARYKTAFHQPFLADLRNFESWYEAGSPKQFEHANRVWKQVLEEYQKPPMPDDDLAGLSEYVERRKREGGVKTDF